VNVRPCPWTCNPCSILIKLNNSDIGSWLRPPVTIHMLKRISRTEAFVTTFTLRASDIGRRHIVKFRAWSESTHTYLHYSSITAMLYLMGLELCDATDITVKGLEVVRKASRVYLEAYASILTVGKEALVGFSLTFSIMGPYYFPNWAIWGSYHEYNTSTESTVYPIVLRLD